MTSDLNILALRYALGELPEADAVAFESQLAGDQLAREALADAVLLTASVCELPAVSAQPVCQQQPASRRRSRLAVVTAGTAAALVVLVLAGMPGSQSTAQRRANREATALVGTWSELGADGVGFQETEGDYSDDDDAAEIPDWMVAAVLDVVEVPPRDEGTL